MISNLLDINKAEAGQMSLTINPFIPREVLEKCVLLFEQRARLGNVSLSIVTSSLSHPEESM